MATRFVPSWPPGTLKPEPQHELKLSREAGAHVVVEKVVVVVVVAVNRIDLAKVAAPGRGANERSVPRCN